jgi:hercynylcysteine S-oxide lyase
MVPNATHGVNTILTNIDWEDGDVILTCGGHVIQLKVDNTTYGAVNQSAKYQCDRHPNIRLESIEIVFPASHAEIIAKTEEVLKKLNKEAKPNYTGTPKPEGNVVGERVKMVIVDQIASNPG